MALWVVFALTISWLSALACSAGAHDDLDLTVLPEWDPTGADSLNVTILGQYRVDSPAGIGNVAAYVDPITQKEYALLAADSLYIVDVSDPRTPSRVAAFPTFGGAVTEPAPPPPSCWKPDPINVYLFVQTWDRYAYAAERHGPIGIIDLSDPTTPVRVSEIPESHFCACSWSELSGEPVCDEGALPEVHRTYIDEDGYLYVAGIQCGEGSYIYDLSTPDAPSWLCHEHTRPLGSTSFYDHDVFASDGILYVSRSRGLRWEIMEREAACAPTVCGSGTGLLTWFPQDSSLAADNHAHSAWKDPNSPFLLTADELEDGHVRIWDTTPVFEGTPEPPTFVASFKPDDTCHSVHDPYVHEGVYYAAWYNKGIQIFGLTLQEGPQHHAGEPYRIGYYEHPVRWHQNDGLCCDPTRSDADGGSGCHGVPFLDFLPGGRFVASELHSGLLVGQYLGATSSVVEDPPDAWEPSPHSELRVLGRAGRDPVTIVWTPIAGVAGRAGDGSEEPHGGETVSPRVDTDLRLEIFSAGGALVTEIAPDQAAVDRAVFRWNGRNADGRTATRGIYFARVRHANLAREHAGRTGGDLRGPATKVVLLR